jgi:hypothetical protein
VLEEPVGVVVDLLVLERREDGDRELVAAAALLGDGQRLEPGDVARAQDLRIVVDVARRRRRQRERQDEQRDRKR